MPELSTQIQHLVDAFVKEVTVVARKVAMDSLAFALQPGGPSAVVAGRRGSAKAPARFAALPKGAKRPAEELGRIRQTVLEYVISNPGKRVEHIKKHLGLETRELVLPIRKLIAEGAIKSAGQKRSTTYYPAGKRSKKAA